MPNPYETWGKYSPYDVIIFLKFHKNWAKIVDFLLGHSDFRISFLIKLLLYDNNQKKVCHFGILPFLIRISSISSSDGCLNETESFDTQLLNLLLGPAKIREKKF